MRAFDGDAPVAQARVDLDASPAVEFLDAALGADRRQLIKQYVENVDSVGRASPSASGRRCYELSQGFMYAYQTALEEALRASRTTRAGSR